MSSVDQFPGNIFFLFYRRLIFPQEIRKKEEFQDEENNEEFDQDNQPEKFSQPHAQETFPVKIVDIPYVRLHFRGVFRLFLPIISSRNPNRIFYSLLYKQKD